jgi:preprotein translocase SecE subunit
VARQRQRARDRKQRAREQGSESGLPQPDHLHRADVPGSLEHSSAAEDEFDAAIVSGAEGDAADDGVGADVSDAEIERQALEAAPAPIVAEEEAINRREGAIEARKAGGVTTGGGNRFINFLRASWAELQRVQWPDRRQVAQATGVVLGFVIIAGLYLGLADWVAQKVVNFVI